MKQIMIDMMALMMPFMKPIAMLGTGLGLLAVLAAVTGTVGGRLGATAAKAALAVGLFFVACEVAGRALGMEPTLLFASDPFDRALYRNQWPFWTVGAALAGLGLVGRRLTRSADA